MNKLTGHTRSGFEFEVDAKALDDMEMIDALAEIMDENPLAFSKVCLKLLGPVQRKALYEHLRGEDGKVPVEAISVEIGDIFRALGEAGKNS